VIFAVGSEKATQLCLIPAMRLSCAVSEIIKFFVRWKLLHGVFTLGGAAGDLQLRILCLSYTVYNFFDFIHLADRISASGAFGGSF